MPLKISLEALKNADWSTGVKGVAASLGCTADTLRIAAERFGYPLPYEPRYMPISERWLKADLTLSPKELAAAMNVSKQRASEMKRRLLALRQNEGEQPQEAMNQRKTSLFVDVYGPDGISLVRVIGPISSDTRLVSTQGTFHWDKCKFKVDAYESIQRSLSLSTKRPTRFTVRYDKILKKLTLHLTSGALVSHCTCIEKRPGLGEGQ